MDLELDPQGPDPAAFPREGALLLRSSRASVLVTWFSYLQEDGAAVYDASRRAGGVLT